MSDLPNLPTMMGAFQSDRFTVTDSHGESVVMYKLGGKVYPMKSVKQCHTCMSDYRLPIESALLFGFSYVKIANSLPEDEDLTANNIGAHVRNGHMPLDQELRRILIEETAIEMGLDPQDHGSLLANHITFARLGIAQVLQDMAEGRARPSVADAIAMANFLDKVESRAGTGVDVQALHELLQVFFDAVMAEVGPEKIEAISRRVDEDHRMEPIMKMLSRRTGEEG